jgi:hypothetical protein
LAGIAARAGEREIGRDDAPVPPDEPPGVRVRSYGIEHLTAEARFRHAAAREFLQVRLAEDERTSLRSFATVKASAEGRESFMLTLPPVVGMSAVLKLSLSTRGMQ